MSDYTYQQVTGYWRHIIDDRILDPDSLPDEVLPTGKVTFTPNLGADGQLPVGDPTRQVSVAPVVALIADGELCDLQGRPGITLVAEIGDAPVWWTAVPELQWAGRDLPGKSITFAPLGTDVNLGDLIDTESLPDDVLPALKDAAISAAQAAASAQAAETAADRAETTAQGVADISDQVDQVDTLVAAAESARDQSVTARNEAVTAAGHAQTVIDDAEDILRTELTDQITAANTASTAAQEARTAAESSAADAATSASAASSSASAAYSSRQAAQSSATNASSSASTATTARAVAEGARDTATTAASNAASSATAADDAASAAAGSAASAASARTATDTAAAAAADSASNAATSADGAAASATAADTSAQVAASNATAAGTAAATASTAASNALASETNAGGAEDAAIAAKTAAETAASNAATSASSASSSETNAGTSETNAATSAAIALQAAEDASEAVGSGLPNAGPATKGGIILAGDLAGTWDAPTVPALADKADLVGGKIPSGQLPAVATTETYSVEDTAERLLLDCQIGDIAIQTGNPGRGTWILQGSDPSEPDDWVLMTPPDGAVASVNGHTGIVVLGKGDIGLGAVDNTADVDKPVSAAQQAALDGKVATTRSITAGTGLTGGGNLTQNRTLAVNFGTSAGTAAQGNDARLSDERIPVNGSVTSAKLADDAVTSAKLAPAVRADIDAKMDDGRIQQVASLPGSPVSGVLYLIPKD